MIHRPPATTSVLLIAIVVALSGASPLNAKYTTLPAPPGPPQITAIHIGFDGKFKLGCWTELTVEVVAGEQPFRGTIEAIAPDSDGVPATTRGELSLAANERKTATLPIRLGQQAGAITIRLVGDDGNGQVQATRTFYPGRDADAGGYATALPSTARLVVAYGAATDLAASLVHADNEASPTADVHSVLVKNAQSLPTVWFGYESVDTVIVSGADLTAYANAELLAPRIAALNRWIELGGRVVIFCGAGSAELLAEGAPLAPLLPGRYSGEIVPLPDETPLEAFAGAAGQIRRASGRDRLRVPRLADVEGRLLAQGPSATALVLRTRRRFGEVTFVAVEPEAEPIASWEDRTSFLRQCLRWPAPAANASRDRGGSNSAPDMVNHLRSALDQHFAGASTISFGFVALLVLGYVALIGPADYFFLRAIKRPHLTWLTFPLVVVGTCAGAYALSHRLKGTESLINQVEIVDVEVPTGIARGAVWTHIYNADVDRYFLSLEPRFAERQVKESSPRDPVSRAAPLASDAPPPGVPPTRDVLIGYLGIPGFGLGAMQGQRAQPSPFERGYGYRSEPTPNLIATMPFEQWSTRTLTARWAGSVGPTIDAALRPRGEDELVGELTNRTGVKLTDCVLIRGAWAYSIPPLADGATYALASSTKPRTLHTTLTSLAAGDDPRARTAEDGSVPFDPLSTDVARITKLMMFYDAIGGAVYAGTPNRYQAFIDMSRLLAGDDAILLARGPANRITSDNPPTNAGEWISSGWRMVSSQPRLSNSIKQIVRLNKNDKQWTYYRFILPLEEPIADAPTSDGPEAEEKPLLGPQPFGR